MLKIIGLALLLSSTAHAATTRISDLPDGGTIQNTDTIPIVRAGTNLKATLPTSLIGGITTSTVLTPDATAVQNTINEHLARETWVQSYGAKCDGSTDDTTAFNNAVSAVSAAGGGIVRLPAGTCVTSGITLKRLVILQGKGRQATILLLKAGANADAVASENFAALTGTGLNYGTTGTFNGTQSDTRVPSWFGLRDLTIDGNSANQAGNSNCYSGYGNAQVIEHVEARNCHNTGFYTEASGGYAYNSTDWKAQEEGFFFDMIARNTGDHGWLMRGPHDSLQDGYVAYDWGHNGSGWGFRNESGSGYSGTAHFGHVHPYTSAGTKNSIYIGGGGDFRFLYADFGSAVIAAATSVDSALLLACGAGGVSPCLDIQSPNVSIAHVSGQWQSATPGTNLVMVNVAVGAEGTFIGDFNGSPLSSTSAGNTLLKVRSNFNDITANAHNMTGTGNVCADIGGTYNIVNVTSYGCKTHVSYTAGDNNTVTVNSYVGGGETFLSGTPNTHDKFYLSSPGVNSNILPSLTVNGDFTTKQRNVAASATLTGTDYSIAVDTSGGAYTETLPAPTIGRELMIFDSTGNAATNNITLDAGAGMTIDGAQTTAINTPFGLLELHAISSTKWITK